MEHFAILVIWKSTIFDDDISVEKGTVYILNNCMGLIIVSKMLSASYSIYEVEEIHVQVVNEFLSAMLFLNKNDIYNSIIVSISIVGWSVWPV